MLDNIQKILTQLTTLLLKYSDGIMAICSIIAIKMAIDQLKQNDSITHLEKRLQLLNDIKTLINLWKSFSQDVEQCQKWNSAIENRFEELVEQSFAINQSQYFDIIPALQKRIEKIDNEILVYFRSYKICIVKQYIHSLNQYLLLDINPNIYSMEERAEQKMKLVKSINGYYKKISKFHLIEKIQEKYQIYNGRSNLTNKFKAIMEKSINLFHKHKSVSNKIKKNNNNLNIGTNITQTIIFYLLNCTQLTLLYHISMYIKIWMHLNRYNIDKSNIYISTNEISFGTLVAIVILIITFIYILIYQNHPRIAAMYSFIIISTLMVVGLSMISGLSIIRLLRQNILCVIFSVSIFLSIILHINSKLSSNAIGEIILFDKRYLQLYSILIVMALGFVFTYTDTNEQLKNYKTIYVENKKFYDTPNNVQESISMNHKTKCAIVYENQDYYFVEPLNENNEIDTSVYLTVNKTDYPVYAYSFDGAHQSETLELNEGGE